jgi:hypothetical protein
MPVAAVVGTPREQQDIALPLVIPFGVKQRKREAGLPARQLSP